jgi:probable phosphoglycerate mutase
VSADRAIRHVAGPDGMAPPVEGETRLWLARHGETAWSRTGKHTGRTDIPLTDRGREQARLLGGRLAGERFVAVRSSPFSRARETLAIARPGEEPEIDEDLRERDYGVAEGRTTAELREEQPGWNSWTTLTDQAETIDEVGLRVDRAIARARAAGDARGGGDVLLVAHGHLLRILAARWLEQPAGFGAQLVLGTASYAVLGSERERPALVRWNVGG